MRNAQQLATKSNSTVPVYLDFVRTTVEPGCPPMKVEELQVTFKKLIDEIKATNEKKLGKNDKIMTDSPPVIFFIKIL